MKIHMIGHASIFVETQDHAILMDPVLWDPHQEGLFDVCPKREVLHERLPQFDFLIISHKHLDHFDIRTLAFLPKTVNVLIPQDELIEKCLRKLGYERIHKLNDFSEIKAGSTRIFTTRSANPVPEFGIVFADESGVFWNQVDTDVRRDTADFVLSRFPKIDFLLASWQPMMEFSYQLNQSMAFPYDGYGQMLDNIRLIKPAALAPGANAFRYIEGSSWLNRIVFPVTREQFCRDVDLLRPELRGNIFQLDPGDVLSFRGEEFNAQPGASPFVRKIGGDREELDFSPVTVGQDLTDEAQQDVAPEVLREAIYEEVETKLLAFIKDRPSLFTEHYRWKVIYQLTIVFADGVEKWSFDFSEATVQMRRGRNPLANFHTFMTASSFYGLLKGTKGWDYAMIGGYYRRFNKIYAITNFGLVQPENALIQDPLELRFPYRKILDSFLLREVERWQQIQEPDAEPSEALNSTAGFSSERNSHVL
ncbi:MAG: MBL fold metallo-hydrolase [Blastocatellia bacterium]